MLYQLSYAHHIKHSTTLASISSSHVLRRFFRVIRVSSSFRVTACASPGAGLRRRLKLLLAFARRKIGIPVTDPDRYKSFKPSSEGPPTMQFYTRRPERGNIRTRERRSCS